MGRAARINAELRAIEPIVQCSGERCLVEAPESRMIKLTQLVDGTFDYVCPTCRQRYQDQGFIYKKVD